MPTPLPPLLLNSSSLTSQALTTLSDLHLIILFSSLVVLLWDWSCHLSLEARILWRGWARGSRGRVRRGRWIPGSRSVRIMFLCSR
jgi:hypothetical protein